MDIRYINSLVGENFLIAIKYYRVVRIFMNNKLIEKAERLLCQCDVCTAASVTENGYPRICVLKHIKTSGIKEFWFSTSASSNKVRHFSKNDKAGVTFYNGGDSVTLIGEMEVIADKAVMDALWQTWMENHFANGGKDDPEYCVIHFTAKEAAVYIDGEYEILSI